MLVYRKSVLGYRKNCAELPEKLCWVTGKIVLDYRKMCADSWRWQAERSIRHGEIKKMIFGGRGWVGAVGVDWVPMGGRWFRTEPYNTLERARRKFTGKSVS